MWSVPIAEEVLRYFVPMANALPSFFELGLVILCRLQPIRYPTVFFAAMGQCSHLSWEQNKSIWLFGQIIDHNPEITHDLSEIVAKRYWVAL